MKPKMTKSSNARKQYTPQFKEQALERAGKDGVPKATLDLGLDEGLSYPWRVKRRQTRRQTGQSFEEQKLKQAENANLKRANVRLEEEVVFLKKLQRTL